MANVVVAYLLWFFSGWCGLHQFYLKRDRHAFFTFSTLGGCFGIGWFRDLFYIPSYVAAANESPEYVEKLTENMRRNDRPKAGLCKWAAGVLLGYIFGILVYILFDKEDLNVRYRNLLAVASHTMMALGVYIPSNEGHSKISFWWCLIGSFLAMPLTWYYGSDSMFYGVLVSSYVVSYKIEWRRKPRTSGFCKRLFAFLFAGLIYLGTVSVAIYYNANITTKDGETVPLRDAVRNFFKSPAWQETKDTFYQLYSYARHHGWRHIWQQILESMDPQGEANAYKVLGLSSSAAEKDIRTAYKKLAMQWHPDKVKDPELKKEAEAKFMEIQQAYDILSKLKQMRSKKT